MRRIITRGNLGSGRRLKPIHFRQHAIQRGATQAPFEPMGLVTIMEASGIPFPYAVRRLRRQRLRQLWKRRNQYWDRFRPEFACQVWKIKLAALGIPLQILPGDPCV